MIKKNASISNHIAPLIILAGTALVVFYQAVDLSRTHKRNLAIFSSFSNGFESYVTNFVEVWRPRFFSNVLAAEVIRFSEFLLNKISVPLVKDPIQLAVGLWTAGWFILIGLLFILWLKNRSPLYILGTFAGISFGYFPIGSTNNLMFPWDMPALFVFSFFIILFLENKHRWLLVLLPLGVGFKETVLILCLAFLFRDLQGSSWNPLQRSFWAQFKKESWLLFFTSVVLCLIVKASIDTYVRVSSPLLTVEYTSEYTQKFLLYENALRLKNLFPFFINAGTLLAFFVLPSSDPKVRTLKLLAAVFALGIFSFGVITEYRIWFEMIPFSLYVIVRAVIEGSTTSSQNV